MKIYWTSKSTQPSPLFELWYWVLWLPRRCKSQEMQAWSLGQEDPLEWEMATHSSIHAWKILLAEEPGGLKSGELQSWTWLSMCTHPHNEYWFTHLLSSRSQNLHLVGVWVGKEFPDMRQNEREIKFIRVGDAVNTVGQSKGEPALNRGP